MESKPQPDKKPPTKRDAANPTPAVKTRNLAKADGVVRRRRRVLRTLAGAVIGSVVAGPIGAAAGAVVGASKPGEFEGGEPAVVPDGLSKAEPRKSTTPREKASRGKRSTRSARKKPFTNIDPNIP